MALLHPATGAMVTNNAQMTPSLPLVLEGLQHLQVTHNRLLGSARRGQVGWLYAFNWSLFVDPISVWNACEIRELAAAQRCPNRQWLISFRSGSSMTDHHASTNRIDGIAQLDAKESVPPIIKHIWGLPLATSVGFGDNFLPENQQMQRKNYKPKNNPQ